MKHPFLTGESWRRFAAGRWPSRHHRRPSVAGRSGWLSRPCRLPDLDLPSRVCRARDDTVSPAQRKTDARHQQFSATRCAALGRPLTSQLPRSKNTVPPGPVGFGGISCEDRLVPYDLVPTEHLSSVSGLRSEETMEGRRGAAQKVDCAKPGDHRLLSGRRRESISLNPEVHMAYGRHPTSDHPDIARLLLYPSRSPAYDVAFPRRRKRARGGLDEGTGLGKRSIREGHHRSRRRGSQGPPRSMSMPASQTTASPPFCAALHSGTWLPGDDMYVTGQIVWLKEGKGHERRATHACFSPCSMASRPPSSRPCSRPPHSGAWGPLSCLSPGFATSCRILPLLIC